MGVFHIFKILQMVPNRAMHHKYSVLQRKDGYLYFFQLHKNEYWAGLDHKGMLVILGRRFMEETKS